MATRGWCALAAAVAILVATPGFASVHNYNFFLDGLQEVPPNASPGFGSCSVSLDDVSFAVNVSCTFNGLLGTATASHIHGLAPAGTNAGVILALTPTIGTSGTITGNGILSAANAQGMLDGLTYINLHTQVISGGEIRGQIVPEPASLALMAMGGMLLLRRRR